MLHLRSTVACAIAALACSCQDSIRARPIEEVPSIPVPAPAGRDQSPEDDGSEPEDGGSEEAWPCPRAGAEPLLLVAEAAGPDIGPWHLYDRRGARLVDLAAGLDLEGWTWVQLSVGPYVFRAVRSDPPAHAAPLAGLWWGGQPSTPLDTQVVVRANRSGVVRLVGLSADGRRTFDLRVEGNKGVWQGFLLSPTGRYLLGTDRTFLLVVDTQEAQTIWTGHAWDAVFSDGDSSLVMVTPGPAAPEVVVQPLPAGPPVVHPAPPGVVSVSWRRVLWPVVATPSGVVFESWQQPGPQKLWLLVPGEGWRAFDAWPEPESVGYLLGFAEGGRVLVATGGSDVGRPAVFGFDLSALSVRRYPAAEGRYGGGRFYDVTGDKLLTWTLEDGAPRELAVLDALSDAWYRMVGQVSEDGCVVSVVAGWAANHMETSWPEDGVLIFNAQGERLVALPLPRWTSLLDRTGTLYAQAEKPQQGPVRLAIADLLARQVHWVDTGMQAPFAAFVHRGR